MSAAGAGCDTWQACSPEGQPGAEPDQAVSLPPSAESEMGAQLQDTQQRLTLKEREVNSGRRVSDFLFSATGRSLSNYSVRKYREYTDSLFTGF